MQRQQYHRGVKKLSKAPVLLFESQLQLLSQKYYYTFLTHSKVQKGRLSNLPFVLSHQQLIYHLISFFTLEALRHRKRNFYQSRTEHSLADGEAVGRTLGRVNLMKLIRMGQKMNNFQVETAKRRQFTQKRQVP